MHIKIDENNKIISIYGRDQGDTIYTEKKCKIGQSYDPSSDTVSGIAPEDKENKLSDLKKKYNSELSKGATYSGNHFDCNSDHVYAIGAKIEAGVYPFDWPVLDNSSVVSIVDATKAGALKTALYLKAEAIKSVYYTVKLPAINSATTQTELDAIDINIGWPQ